MFQLRNANLHTNISDLSKLPDGKLRINTINAYSYNTTYKDPDFAAALKCGDILLPDGVSIVKACRWLRAKSQPQRRITGWDLFSIEMSRLEAKACQEEDFHPTVMFVGSTEHTLSLIQKNASGEYPHLRVKTYSPPFVSSFTAEESQAIVDTINETDPDLLWIGMTAPKQEKWAYSHWSELNIHCHCGTVGAVFDFFAGTRPRAPKWWQDHSLEWLYRLFIEPRRM